MEMFAVRSERCPTDTIAPGMGFDEVAYAFRALGVVVGDKYKGEGCVGVETVSTHDVSGIDHLRVWFWGWSCFVDLLKKNPPKAILWAMKEGDGYEFSSMEQGEEFIGNLRKSIEQWDPFVEENDLNLIVQA